MSMNKTIFSSIDTNTLIKKFDNIKTEYALMCSEVYNLYAIPYQKELEKYNSKNKLMKFFSYKLPELDDFINKDPNTDFILSYSSCLGSDIFIRAPVFYEKNGNRYFSFNKKHKRLISILEYCLSKANLSEYEQIYRNIIMPAKLSNFAFGSNYSDEEINYISRLFELSEMWSLQTVVFNYEIKNDDS